jgi:hypothetical protein
VESTSSGEVRHFVEQAMMVFQGHAPVEPPRVSLEVARDPIAPLGVLEDDEVLLEARLVLFEAADLDRAAGPAARRQETMAVGQRARLDVLHQRAGGVRRPADGEWHDAAAIEEQQPADRAAEHELAAPVVERRVPLHLLGKGQIPEHAAEHRRQRVDGALAALPLEERQVLALGRLRASKLVDRHALLPGEADGRRRRLTVGAERCRDGRTRDQLFEVLLTLGDLGEPRRQSPRRRVRLDWSAGRNPRILQPRFDPLAELPRQPRQPGGGQFLDADFDQEFSIHSGLLVSLFGESFLSGCVRDHECAPRWHDATTTRRHDVD